MSTLPPNAATHGNTAVAAGPVFTATAEVQVDPWSDDAANQTVWASDQAAYIFPLAGSTARAGNTLFSAVLTGAWDTIVGTQVRPWSMLRDTTMLLKFALVAF